MMRAIVQRWLGIAAAFLLAAASLSAQGSGTAVQNVRGQIYLPGGEPLQMQLRILLESEDASRPPEYHYTDSHGRFVLPRISANIGYMVTVESDGKTWGTTVERFLVLGPRYVLRIHLRPLETVSKQGSSSVSARTLQQDVPRAARREYEKALEELRRGEAERARVLLTRAVELFPDFVMARTELAVVMLRAGELAAAEGHLRRAIQVDSAAVLAQLNLGLCLYRQERYADALLHLDRAVQLNPSNARAVLLQGIVLARLQEFDRAEPALRRAYELNAQAAARANYYLAHIYTRQKDYARAASALETYLSDVPNDPAAADLRVTLTRLRAAKPQ